MTAICYTKNNIKDIEFSSFTFIWNKYFLLEVQTLLKNISRLFFERTISGINKIWKTYEPKILTTKMNKIQRIFLKLKQTCMSIIR